MRLPKIGAKVKVIANTANHCFAIGTEVTVQSYVDPINGKINCKDAKGSLYTLNRLDYKQDADIESLKSEMASLEKELFQVKKCVEYLELTGKTEADINEVNAYYVLQLVADKKMSDVDKSVEIARLLS